MNTIELKYTDGTPHTVNLGHHAVKAVVGGIWGTDDIGINVYTRPDDTAGYTVWYNFNTRTTRRERTRVHWSNGRQRGTDILPLV